MRKDKITTEYPNAISVRLKNRRITVGRGEGEESGLFVETRIATTDDTPRAISTHVKGRVMCTLFALSDESAKALMMCLADRLGYVIGRKESVQQKLLEL